jgi:inhibitor of KinA
MKIKIQEWSVFSVGDHALVFALEAKMDVAILQKIKQLNEFILTKKINGILDIIPSYHTLTVVYDMIHFLSDHHEASDPLNIFSTTLINEFDKISLVPKKQITLYHVPVCYDLLFALDLEKMSEAKNISIEEIIKIHCSTIYDVYSIGFVPGFTYMGMVNEKIQMARHQKPRNQVNAGSVGIAGLQTGIYPINSPGGWQIIGKTPWKIFDTHPNKLAKFKVGDQVQFFPISKKEFDDLNEYK